MKRCLLLLLLTACGFRLNAQIQDPQWGLAPYQTFSGSDFDHVNVRNGIVNFTIPLFSYPQRGGRLPQSLALNYNSQYYGWVITCDPADPSDCQTNMGHASLSTVRYSAYTYANFRALQSAGFRFVENDSAIVLETGYYHLATQEDGNGGTPERTDNFIDYEMVTSDGSAHPFNILAGTGNGNGLTGGLGMSLDGTGYRSSQFGLLDRQGNASDVHDANGNALGDMDADGNTIKPGVDATG